MSKLNYCEDGIYKYCADYIRDCLSSISSARVDSTFCVPDDFSYKKCLDDLNGVLGEYYNEINGIGLKLKDIDNNFNDLSSRLEDDVSKMSSVRIKDRDRMII